MFKPQLPIDAETAAYHEAGHITFAYFVQWCTKKVELIEQNGRIVNAVTTYNFKEDEKIVKSLSDQQIFNTLTQDEKNRIYGVIHKRCTSLLGGPITEAFLINGINFKGQLPIDLRGPDAINSYDLEKLMRHIYNEHNLVQNSLMQLTPITLQKIFWKSIESIAKKILNTKDFTLSQNEIESILFINRN